MQGKGRRPVGSASSRSSATPSWAEWKAYVRNLIANLPREEFDVILICPFESAYTRSLREKGWQVDIAPLRDDPPWRSIEMICNLVRQHKIDVIHAHLMNAHTVSAVAGRIMGVPVVATIHGMTSIHRRLA